MIDDWAVAGTLGDADGGDGGNSSGNSGWVVGGDIYARKVNFLVVGRPWLRRGCRARAGPLAWRGTFKVFNPS
jgi:hypothetical protein